MDRIPPHIHDLANGGNAVVMNWVYDKQIPPLNAKTATAYIRIIHHEFLSLLYTHKDSDDVFRRRLVEAHAPFRAFADRHPTLYKTITTREKALHPPTISAILFQADTIAAVQDGTITESEGEALAASSVVKIMLPDALKQQGMPTSEPGRDRKEP